ncbi:unnamed protein product [Mytilus coruscus]|uniref:Ig-like domain-containing protein n=1 Tax=Mytilus coruscus TaxID=42192 RepID=A0A6J8ELX6_MYTCO|nr:unnamed protein product [Mytilus coruscus]
MEPKRRKSGSSLKESRDIMPCTHTLNWNTDDQETDREFEEGGSDVMELKVVRPDKMLFEKTTHDTEPANSEDIKEMKSCEQINIEAVNKMTTNASQQTKVFEHDKTLCEKITNEAGPVYSKYTSKNRFGQQTKDCKPHERIKSKSAGKENNEAMLTRSKDNEKNESVENEQDDFQKIRSDTRNKNTKQSQYEQSSGSKCEDQKHLKTPSEKRNNDAVITISTDQETHEPVKHKKAKWQLNNTHVVFGESVALKCSLATNICKNDSSRRWSKCRYQEFLITNGKSTNPNKYREVLSPDCYTSYLIINNFTKEDMNVEYTFGYSTEEFSRELQLERSMYTRYPENETTTSEVNCKKNNLSFILKLVDINPVPNCTMVVMNDTITSEGNVHNTSEYFSNIEYRFHYQLQHDYSKRKIRAWCDFGTKNVTVFDVFFKCNGMY